MQMDRRFELLYILLEKKQVTAKMLAEQFGVSTRTIYRDIEALSGSGIPVYMTKGKNGGISLLPNFVLDRVVLTDKEKSNILAALQAIHAINPEAIDMAWNKLSHLFETGCTNWIEIDFSTWIHQENEVKYFQMLQSAILNRYRISFSYVNGKGEQMTRKVEPLKLCFKGQAWYLFGYCQIRESTRFFKLRRIRDLTVLYEHFIRTTPTTVFTNQPIFQEEFVCLKLKIAHEMAFRVYDEFSSFWQLEDGSFIVEINYPKGDWLWMYITSFGAYCEVLEPLEIREAFQAHLQKILANYL